MSNKDWRILFGIIKLMDPTGPSTHNSFLFIQTRSCNFYTPQLCFFHLYRSEENMPFSPKILVGIFGTETSIKSRLILDVI